MAQHETTMNLIRTRTIENEYEPELNDVMLADHGTGSHRHRAFTIGEIGALLASGTGINPLVLKDFDVGGYWKMEAKGESITLSRFNGNEESANKVTVSLTDGLELENAAAGGGKTSAVIKNDGIVVKTENSGSSTQTKIEYDKVTTPAVDTDFVDSEVTKSGLYNVKGDCVITLNADVSLIGFDDGAYNVGDVVLVYNTTNAALKLYFAYIGGPAYVEIKSQCSVPFRCMVAGRNNWQWSPLANVDYTVESH